MLVRELTDPDAMFTSIFSYYWFAREYLSELKLYLVVVAPG